MKELREARQSIGATLGYMSRKTSIGLSRLSGIENGRVNPYTFEVERMKSFLGTAFKLPKLQKERISWTPFAHNPETGCTESIIHHYWKNDPPVPGESMMTDHYEPGQALPPSAEVLWKRYQKARADHLKDRSTTFCERLKKDESD